MTGAAGRGTGVDLAVVGAGFVGAAIALTAVLRRPDRRVALIDAGQAGGGAVRHCSAMLMPFGATPRVRRMTAESGRFYDRLAAASPVALIEEHPFAWIVEAGGLDGFREMLLDPEAATAAAAPDLQRHFPSLALAAGETVIAGPGVRRGRPSAILDAMVRAFLSRPAARLVEGTAVRGIARRGDGLEVATDAGGLAASRVAVSIGAWLPHGPLAAVARHRGVESKKVVSAHLPLIGPEPAVGLGFPAEEVYLMPEPDRRRWLVSITSPDWGVDPDAAPPTADAADRRLAAAFVRRRLGLPAEALDGMSTFADAYAADRQPIVACHPELGPTVAIATGTAGYGLKVAPALAAETLDLLDRPAAGAALAGLARSAVQ